MGGATKALEVGDVADLKGAGLDEALKSYGLSTSGNAGTKRERLLAHLEAAGKDPEVTKPPAPKTTAPPAPEVTKPPAPETSGLTTGDLNAPPVEVPDGDVDELLAWISEPEDFVVRAKRADALWVRETQGVTLEDEAGAELSAKLRAAVYDGIEDQDPDVQDPDVQDPPPAAEQQKPAKGERKYIVLREISGTRNGIPWPKPGEPIFLPPAEAEDYLKTYTVAEPVDR